MCVCGISIWKKGWRLYDLDTKDIFVSQDVKFFRMFSFSCPNDVKFNSENFITQENIHIDFAIYDLGNVVCKEEDEILGSKDPQEDVVISNCVQDPAYVQPDSALTAA